MESLLRKSNLLIQDQSLQWERSLARKIDWKDRLIGIFGARGTGKTTLLLQHLKKKYGVSTNALYVSLDDIYFTENRLTDVAEIFRQRGGKILFLDEVHKYPRWEREVKNLYDLYKDLQIVFTGSSIIELMKQNIDLSRRAVQYEMAGLSYREYLQFTGIIDFESITLADLLTRHIQIATGMVSSFRPLQHFAGYLQSGYYPFFAENLRTYPVRLEQMIKMIIETDLQFLEGFDPHNTRKIYQLLYILSANVPFKPNISKLSERIGIHRNTLTQYIHYLEKARLINTLSAAGKSISILQKPDKIFLENPNLHHVLSENVNKGSIREAFFLNQFRNAGYSLSLPANGDFMVNEKYIFEIGGKNKPYAQVSGIENAFIIADDMETGVYNKIPLWLIGFMY
jgi:predicted AAA+ superfamily ATPase